MKKINLMFVCILLGVVLHGEAKARQASGQPEITTGKLVNALRLLNTHEYSYKNENSRFADRDQNALISPPKRTSEQVADRLRESKTI